METTSLLIRMPPELKAALAERAASQERSITGHVIFLIKQDLRQAEQAEQAETTPALQRG